MTFEETLATLQGWIGQEVAVSVSAADGRSDLLMNVVGVLRRADPSPAHELLQEIGREAPDDEVLMFQVGEGDLPRKRNTFYLKRSRFRGAAWERGAIAGDRFLWIESAGGMFTIRNIAESMQALGITDPD